MRIGTNPVKFDNEIHSVAYHRVIVPVYIPNFEGYFEKSFEVFKLCLESLLKTVHSQSRITIYNNNCHELVKKYIDEQFAHHQVIDQVFHSKENLGKINAILAASKGNLEPFITITDADVLFKHNWQSAVEEVFCEFPEAGMVSPVPSSRAYKNYTAANWCYSLFKGKLFFGTVLEPDALVKFDHSLGNEDRLYKQIHLEKYLIHRNRNNFEAVMGCGHFVATLRRTVFDKGTRQPAFIKIQGGVETKFIDYPNQQLGFMRLATKNNFAFHMGNFTEPWMYEEFEQLNTMVANKPIPLEKLNNSNPMSKLSLLVGKVIQKLLLKDKIRKFVFLKLGLKSKDDY